LSIVKQLQKKRKPEPTLPKFFKRKIGNPGLLNLIGKEKAQQ
jgi:hypothetical protein